MEKNKSINEIRSLMHESKNWNKIWEKLSPSAKEIFKSTLKEKKIKNTLEIIEFFNINRIEYVVLKGITLQHFNKNREFNDLDIFVKKNEIRKVSELLKNKEYIPNEDELNKFNKNKGFHIAFEKPGNITIEVHYLLLDCSYFNETNLPILTEKETIEIKNIKIPCLSKEMQLLEIFIHNLYNHGFIVNYKKWFEDIETIITNYNIDWNKFLELVKKSDTHEIIYRSIKLLNKFNNKEVNIPKEIVEKIKNKCSKTKLWLTKIFDNKFYKNYENIKNKSDQSERFRLSWKLKYCLYFTAGFNIRFFKLLWFYIWSFKLKIPEIIPFIKKKVINE